MSTIWSVAVLAATNSDPKVAVSTVALLKGESAISGSPRDITVVPMAGEETLKQVTPRNDLTEHADDGKANEKVLSWADIARR